jgi:hypothetical protein
MASSSFLARLVIEATRLQNISAKSSLALARASCTMQTSSAVRFRRATSPITPASAAVASPAKSAIFASATPSSHLPVSPRESAHAMWATWARNADHDARPAVSFKR